MPNAEAMGEESRYDMTVDEQGAGIGAGTGPQTRAETTFCEGLVYNSLTYFVFRIGWSICYVGRTNLT